ncbi:type IV toxin-antitoxin system AbiEi family antitoxin domain-containing protein [Nocardioides sp.]|uniref:type IV toxin-antitoxin system AbiEi family antitoxin domain-containing protein n=1 Tax=Nocardioides sp. TaxID=35761 RepID=UPI002B84A87B|nr:type IV toxin-antitoxin system AbiEi family antitoxin domain-containing protein [Nocardioides sp.]HSX68012.1 type IV toxin-antitoxin system AbiEi family antitoxin domain-containing protein [Nocardioides sp.]
MDDTRLLRLKRHHGLITIAAALEAGFDRREVARLVASGRWIPLRRGVYVEKEIWEAADIWSTRPRLLSRAADLRLRGTHVFSHDSAALEHGIALIGSPDHVHVTRAGITGSRRRDGIAQHGATYDPGETQTIDGLPVLPLARTAIDIAREHGYAAGVVAMDSALRLGASPQQLSALREAMARWPGITSAQAAVDDADPGAETAGESLARALVLSLGIGRPRTQFPVRLEDGSIAWLDMVVGCHAFEFDGRVKLMPASAGGVATTSAEQVVWDEKKRERLIRPLGLGISRIIWTDTTTGVDAARSRLATEYRQTAARLGTRLDSQLEEFAARMEPQRQRRLRATRRVPPLD